MDKITIRNADDLLNTVSLLYVSADACRQKVNEMIEPLVDIFRPRSIGARRYFAVMKFEDCVHVGFQYMSDDTSIDSSVQIPLIVWNADDPLEAAKRWIADQPACGANKEDRIAEIRARMAELRLELDRLEDEDY